MLGNGNIFITDGDVLLNTESLKSGKRLIPRVEQQPNKDNYFGGKRVSEVTKKQHESTLVIPRDQACSALNDYEDTFKKWDTMALNNTEINVRK